MITITTFIIIISIIIVLSSKEAGLLVAILLVCYCFPALAVIVVTLAVLAHHAN